MSLTIQLFFLIYFLTLNFSMSITTQRIILPSKPVPENSLDFCFSFFFEEMIHFFVWFSKISELLELFSKQSSFFYHKFSFWKKKSLECSKKFLLIRIFSFSILSHVFLSDWNFSSQAQSPVEAYFKHRLKSIKHKYNTLCQYFLM